MPSRPGLIIVFSRTMISRTIARTTSIVSAVREYVVFSPPLASSDQCLLQRAGMKGTAFTYFTTDNAKSARELLAILREAKADIPPQLEEMASYGGGGGRGESRHCSAIVYVSNPGGQVAMAAAADVDVVAVMVVMAVEAMAIRMTMVMDHEVVGEIAGKGSLDCFTIYSLLHGDALSCNVAHYLTWIDLRHI
jgi:hypothetical protein